MTRFLYLLKLRKQHTFEYDYPDGFVVSAESPIQARRIAQKASGEKRWDGTPRWLDPQDTTVRKIGLSTVKQGVVLTSERAG